MYCETQMSTEVQHLLGIPMKTGLNPEKKSTQPLLGMWRTHLL